MIALPQSIHGPVHRIEITGGFTLVNECDLWLIDLIQWRIDSDGYVRGAVPGGKRGTPHIRLHRAILSFPLVCTDHANRLRFDNRRCNLRLASKSQNAANMKAKGALGLKGVTRKGSKFVASITIDGSLKYLGRFSDKYEAAKKYDQVAIELFGQYAATNASLGLLPSSAPLSLLPTEVA